MGRRHAKSQRVESAPVFAVQAWECAGPVLAMTEQGAEWFVAELPELVAGLPEQKVLLRQEFSLPREGQPPVPLAPTTLGAVAPAQPEERSLQGQALASSLRTAARASSPEWVATSVRSI